jgi:hypothetical protein
MNIQIGSIIRSYDFHFVNDYYFVGEVTKIEGDYIYCNTLAQFRAMEEQEITEKNSTFRAVKQGAMLMDDEFQRIIEQPSGLWFDN